ncbi:MAG: CYTH domain-containing protein [Odoribacteraceae bacterium]|jgi:CYTH domain-containing protein|nr:CYTH domain-containing protein [Odoribacteraceae bacterium]
MSQEIERKFLVRGEFKSRAFHAARVAQGYLSSAPARTVRVRVMDDRGFITVKGEGAISRFEWEKEIPVGEARELLALCEPGIIEKTRYRVQVGRHVFEVDEFRGAREGLIVAEVELAAEDEPFERPEWLGEEVTGNPAYYNAALRGE